jgi:uncharacterized protein (TIGR02145 family)
MDISDYDEEYSIKLYSGSTQTASYSTSVVDSIKFSTTHLSFYIDKGTNPYTYTLSTLDSMVFSAVQSGGITDTVRIGTQTWMRRNLDVTHYRNGDSIAEVRDSATWGSITYGAWCYYNNDPANDSIYGKLYNWYAVNDSRGLDPTGWHVPSDNEWKTLETYLGMSQSEVADTGYRGTNEGSKLAGRADLWYDGALKQNQYFNSSGFSALPGGWRGYDGAFHNIGGVGSWWSATGGGASSAWGGAWATLTALSTGTTPIINMGLLSVA